MSPAKARACDPFLGVFSFLPWGEVKQLASMEYFLMHSKYGTIIDINTTKIRVLFKETVFDEY